MNRRLLPLVIALPTIAGSACEESAPEPMPVLPIDDLSLTIVSPEDDALWGVKDVFDADGTYWALTASAPFVHGFGPTGQLTARFGSAGPGPGEFRFPAAAWPGHTGGSLTVWDPGAYAALTFSGYGSLLSSLNAPMLGAIRSDIETVTFGDPFRAVSVPGGFLTARFRSGVNHPGDLWNGDLLHVPADGGEPRVLIDFAAELPGAEHRSAAMLLVPVPLWDGCADGRTAVLDPIARKLFVLDPAAPERQEIDLPWQPDELRHPARLEYMKARIRAEVGDEDVSEAEILSFAEEAVQNGERLFPPDAPIAVDIKCAPGLVWIQEFHTNSHPLGFGPSWRTVSLDTDRPKWSRVVFPAGFNPHRISESRAIGVVVDVFGLERVATVSLPSRSPARGTYQLHRPGTRTLAEDQGELNP